MNKKILIAAILILVVTIGLTRFDRKAPDPVKKQIVSGKTGRPAENYLTISLVGDMCFDNLVAERMKQKGDDFLFSGYADYFKNSDILIGNLETPLTSVEPDYIVKEYHFRSNPDVAKFLKKYNFTAVSIANNHILDSGREGLYETVQTLYKNDIGFAGGEYNLEKAVKPFIKRAKGMKIGFLAFTKVIPSYEWAAGERKYGVACAYSWHEKVYKDAIASAKKQCDILVVSVHWGKEGVSEVDADEMSTARKMIDSGADIIMGHHPHVVSGIDYYREKPIFYSLGNFIFTMSNNPESNRTIMARVVVNSRKKIEDVSIIPGNIIESAPVPMQGAEMEAYVRKFMKGINNPTKKDYARRDSDRRPERFFE